MKKLPALVASLFFASLCFAQSYPARTVKVVVPWPPGQATDVAARMVAQKLQESLGQAFVIDNKPGAGGMIGTDVAAKSVADGYTLLAASSGPVSIMPNVQKVPYDPLKDLAPVSLIALTQYALVTSPAFPAANAAQFVALLRANPDKYAFASSGTGATSHLIIEVFNSAAKVSARHVPYKGSAPGLTDVMSGQVDYTIETVTSLLGHVKSGRLKVLGVTLARPTAAMPEVPPLATAANLPGFEIGGWIGYAAPPGTPREVVARLSQEVQKAVRSSDIQERFIALGLDPMAGSPEQMMAFLRKEQDRYAAIVKAANIRLDQ